MTLTWGRLWHSMRRLQFPLNISKKHFIQKRHKYICICIYLAIKCDQCRFCMKCTFWDIWEKLKSFHTVSQSLPHVKATHTYGNKFPAMHGSATLNQRSASLNRVSQHCSFSSLWRCSSKSCRWNSLFDVSFRRWRKGL